VDENGSPWANGGSMTSLWARYVQLKQAGQNTSFVERRIRDAIAAHGGYVS
jgi:hypothetical protein